MDDLFWGDVSARAFWGKGLLCQRGWVILIRTGLGSSYRRSPSLLNRIPQFSFSHAYGLSVMSSASYRLLRCEVRWGTGRRAEAVLDPSVGSQLIWSWRDPAVCEVGAVSERTG